MMRISSKISGLTVVLASVASLLAALHAFHSSACRAEKPPAAVKEAEATPPKATEKKPAPKSVDLRPTLDKFELEPRVQGGRNTCSVFAVTAAVEFAYAKKHKQGLRLSVEFLNWAANQPDHSDDDGGNFDQIWKGFEAHGICPEVDMPYRDKYDPSLKPSDEAVAHAKEMLSEGLKLHWIKEWDDSKGVSEKQLDRIKRTLARGRPVSGGFLWPKSGHWTDNLLKVVPRDKVIDGHSVLLVGYRDDEKQPGGGAFLFRNTAGSARDSEMTYEYALAYMNDAIWIGFSKPAKGGKDAEK
jgi:hypothetical protein